MIFASRAQRQRHDFCQSCSKATTRFLPVVLQGNDMIFVSRAQKQRHDFLDKNL